MKVLFILIIGLVPLFYSEDTEGMPAMPLMTLCNAQFTRCNHYGNDASGCDENRVNCNATVHNYMKKAWTDCRKVNTTETCDGQVREEYNVLKDKIRADENFAATAPPTL